MSIKIGVVGVGNMGENHVRVLSQLIGKYELVGVFDSDNKKAARIANRYDTTAYSDLEQLLKNCEAVSIVAPSSFHKDLFDICADAGRHVLVEKPLALSVSDAADMISKADNKKIILMTGHIERYNPVTNCIYDIIENEKVIALDFHRLSNFDQRISDADVVQDLMIHDIDIMNSLLESEIQSVKSEGVILFSENYDYVQTLIGFENGVKASLTASRITETKVRQLQIHTEDSYIIADYLNRTINIFRKTRFNLDVGYDAKYKQENIIEKLYVPIKEPLVLELEQFANAINTGAAPPTDGRSGLNALKVVERIKASL